MKFRFFADEFSEVQSISFGRGFALCLDFCLLPSCSPVGGSPDCHVIHPFNSFLTDIPEPLLVTGGDDARVNIYIWKNGQVSTFR